MSWLSCPAVSYISVFGMLWLCRFYWHWLSVPTLWIEVLSYKFLGEQRILFLMFPAWSRIERADGSQSSLRMILSPHTHRIVWALNNDSPNNVGLEQDLDPPKDSQVFIVAVPFFIYIYTFKLFWYLNLTWALPILFLPCFSAGDWLKLGCTRYPWQKSCHKKSHRRRWSGELMFTIELRSRKPCLLFSKSQCWSILKNTIQWTKLTVEIVPFSMENLQVGDDFRSQVAYHTVGHRTISYQTLSGFCVEAADV